MQVLFKKDCMIHLANSIKGTTKTSHYLCSLNKCQKICDLAKKKKHSRYYIIKCILTYIVLFYWYHAILHWLIVWHPKTYDIFYCIQSYRIWSLPNYMLCFSFQIFHIRIRIIFGIFTHFFKKWYLDRQFSDNFA